MTPLSHPLLDGVMHADVQPLWPFSSANPFLERVDIGLLHALCLAAGALGLLLQAGKRTDTGAS
jgi:membrane-bound metal-dependent hydrolase YbcI (DUF457 family)